MVSRVTRSFPTISIFSMRSWAAARTGRTSRTVKISQIDFFMDTSLYHIEAAFSKPVGGLAAPGEQGRAPGRRSGNARCQ
jgi:hypothetical protein